MQTPSPSLRSRPRFSFEDFPDRLVAWIEFRGLSVTALSSLTGVSRSLISKWRTRDASPSMSSAHKVARALGVPAAEFFCETPWERLRRCLMSHAMATPSSQSAARLAGVRGLERGDFVACVNRVPLDAVPLLEPGTDIVGWLSPDGVRQLVGLPLFEAEGAAELPTGHGRRDRAIASLREFEVELRRWRYQLEDTRLVSRAIEELATVG